MDACNLLRAAALAGALALTAPTGQALAQDRTVHSVWVGAGLQDNGMSWTIEVTYYTDSSVEIAYPSLNCGGRLDLIGAEPGGGYRYRETLTFDQSGICLDHGDVVLRNLKPNELEYLYYYSGRPTEPGGTGHLRFDRN